MGKLAGSLDLALPTRPPDETLVGWLYRQLRAAILERRLPPGTMLPASRDFARQYRLSRGTVVSVLERLVSEGYLCSRVGSGTWVNPSVAIDPPAPASNRKQPAYIRRVASSYSRPKAFAGLTRPPSSRPFQMQDPAVTEFPSRLWASLLTRRARSFSSWLTTEDHGRGYGPLRAAIAHYLASSRGVRCSPDQILIVSGVQQALDLLARVLLQPTDSVWIEDPGYFGAAIALESAGVNIVPVPVDEQGLSISAGIQLHRRAKGVYVTPAHQFPMGVVLSLERRMALLKWATRSGAFIIEDDYDSEYRFEGRPIPALQSLDAGSHVILVGSFSKLLFPSLRIGYLVAPPALVDFLLAFRYRTDLRSLNLDHAVLCDFITDGHLGRHLRRMRDLYGNRLACLMDLGRKHLHGLLNISGFQSGLYTAAFLQNGMTSRQAEKAAGSRDVDAMGLDRFCLKCSDPRGLLLGFAAFNETEIRKGVVQLAAALDRRSR